MFHLINFRLLDLPIRALRDVGWYGLVQRHVVVVVLHDFLHTLAVGGVPHLLLLHCLHLVRLDFVAAQALLHAHGLDHGSLLLLLKELVAGLLLVIYRLLNKIVHQLDGKVCRLWYAPEFPLGVRI